MNIKTVLISEIQRAAYNPRKTLKPGDPAYDKLKKAVTQFGLVEPLVWNSRTKNLVGGHQRLSVIEERGDLEVEVSVVDLSERDEKVLNLALNKQGGEWDYATLADLLNELNAGGSDMDITGFNPAELEKLMAWTASNAGKTNEDAVPEPPSEPITKLGDLWLLGTHRLLCGDSTKPDDVARLMNGKRASLMATDPPYLVDYQGGTIHSRWANKGVKNKDKHWDDYLDPDKASDFFEQFLAAALPHLLPYAAIYQWHASARQVPVQTAWERNGLHVHQTVIWVKARPVLTRCHYMWQFEPCFYGWVKGKSPKVKPPANTKNVWEINQQGESDGIHPTQKPVELFRRPLLYHTAPGGLAYEPFSGSGTAIIAAESEGRRVYAMELAPAFVDVAVKRWEDFTGKKAERA